MVFNRTATPCVSSALLVVVNYSDSPADGHLPLRPLHGTTLASYGIEGACPVADAQDLVLIDMLSDAAYVRDMEQSVEGEGLWVRLEAWQAQVFEVRCGKWCQ